MNQLTAHNILHHMLQYRSRIASDKVAVRWLLANLMSNARDYDLFFRLQILEGAFGVREGIWWTRGRAGLAGAKEAAEGTALNPEWLEPGNTGMFRILYNKVENFINKHGVNTEADDIIQAVLMGIAKDLSPKKKKAYEAGKIGSKKILSGRETPKQIAAGVLSKWVTDEVVTEAVKTKQITKNKDRSKGDKNKPIFKQRKHIQEDSDATPIGESPADKKRKEKDSLAFLTRIILDDMNNPAGKKIRAYMRKSWGGTGQEAVMNVWLDAIEHKKTLKKQEIAKIVGINPQPVGAHWRKAWRKFFTDFRRNIPLIHFLEDYFILKGLVFPRLDLTSVDSILPEKKRI